MKPGTKETMS